MPEAEMNPRIPPPANEPGGARDDLNQTLDRIAAALERRNEQGAGDQAGGSGKEGDGEQGQSPKGDGDKPPEGEGKQPPEGGDDKKKDGKGGDGKQEDGKDGDKPKSKKPSKKAILIGVVVVLLIVAAGVFFWLGSRNKVSTDDAYVTGHVHQVSARISGTVEGVDVDDNQIVEEGQVVVRLDPRDYLVARDRAAAALAQASSQALQARANVAQTAAAVIQAQAQVTQQQAQASQAQANLELAQINFNRNRGLYQRDAKAVAKADVDTTQSNLGAQQAQLDAARANVEAAKANVQAVQAQAVAAEANVNVAEANVGVARAGLADAELQLSYCRVLAPVGGKVSRKTVESGQRLSAGQALLAIVPENVWVLANFKETQLERLVVGQRVDVKVDALPHHVFLGTVDSIQEGSGATFSLLPPDNATGNFTKIVQRVPVKIVFDEDSVRDFKDKIVPGLSVVPKVDLLSATPGKPADKAEKREEKRQEQKAKQNREREEGKL